MIDRAFYFALNSGKNGILVLLYIFFILLLLTFARQSNRNTLITSGIRIKTETFREETAQEATQASKTPQNEKMNVSDENNTAEANDENSTPSAKHTDIKHLGIIYAFFTTKTELIKERNYTTFIPKRTQFYSLFIQHICLHIFIYLYNSRSIYIHI